jgi:nitric oxide reductase subunit B
MVGAWNQMIYGTSLYIMVKLTGDEQLASNKKAVFFYFLGVTNLMFNWGHHIYNVPTASWIRHVSYAISMTEWVLLISIIRDFKQKAATPNEKASLTRRFLSAAEYWVLANLILAIFMSIPAINRYTHGTHITVAHAMGATIGINTMILLSSLSYMLKVDSLPENIRQRIRVGYSLTQFSLTIFWASLIAAGIMKGYRDVHLNMSSFREMMEPVISVLHVFAIAGVGLLVGLTLIAINFMKAAADTTIPEAIAKEFTTHKTITKVRMPHLSKREVSEI